MPDLHNAPESKQSRLRKMLLQVAPDGQLERMKEQLDAFGGEESGEAAERLDVGGGDDVGFEIETLDIVINEGPNANLDEHQQDALEAIIHRRYRPAIFVENNSFGVPPHPWQELADGARRENIERAILSVGRIELPHHPRVPYGGTGFVVGEGLVMTNRHVAALFARGVGQRALGFEQGQSAALDLEAERGSRQTHLLTVSEVVMIHPYWDMALLRVTGLPEQARPLALSVQPPEELADRTVVVIGYPAQDPRNNVDLQNRIFGGVYEVKRMQPGKLLVREAIESYGRDVLAVTHDCSTLGGNSGSVVIDASTGHAVGLHFAGIYLRANYAVPTFELATDSRVVDSGINFTGPLPASDFYPSLWREADPADESSPSTLTGNSASSHRSRIAVATDRPTAVNAAAGVNPAAGRSTWTIPLEVSVTLHAPVQLADESRTDIRVVEPEGLFGRRGPSRALPFRDHFFVDALAERDFHWEMAYSAALASRLAYSEAIDVRQTASDSWRLQTCESLSLGVTQCFVASSADVVLVSFRGTESVGDWLADLRILSVDQPYGTVHRGFLAAFRLVAERLDGILDRLGNRPIVITGHSLGGALAVIAAAEWVQRRPVAMVYTYGQPAVGKGQFPGFMRDAYGERYVRIVNDDDVVARVPPTYEHVGRLIHLNRHGNVETLAQESLTVADPRIEETMSEAQFGDLQDQLHATGHGDTAVPELATADAHVEGFLPSFRDHRMENYLVKIQQHVRFP